MKLPSLKIHRRELGGMLLLGSYFFLIIAAHYVLKPARNALFLQELGADRLPWVYILTALAIWPVVSVYTRLAPGRRLVRLVQGTLLFLLSNLLLFWYFLPRYGQWTYGLFYVWVKLYAVLLPSQFWLMANEVLDPRQAKRLFGPIGAGGVLGGIAGSMLAGTLPQWIGTNNLLLAAAAGLAAAALVLGGIASSRLGHDRLDRPIESSAEVLSGARRRGGSRAAAEDEGGAVTDGPGDPAEEAGRRLLRAIALLLTLMMAVHTIVDWQFNKAAELYIADLDQRTEFFGRFFALLNVITLVVQLVATSWVLQGLGIGVALLVMPICLAAGSLAVLVLPSLWVISSLRASDDALRYSLDQSTREVLFLPVPSSLRARIKPRIDLIASRAANGIGGLLILAGVAVFDAPISGLAMVALALIAVWTAVAVVARSRYTEALRGLLRVRDVDVEHLVRARLDSNALEAVRDGLTSDDPETVRAALALAERTDPAEFVDELVELARQRRGPTRRVLRLLNEAGDSGALDVALEVIDQKGSGARAEAIAYACALGDDRTREEIETFLRSSQPELMSAAAVCLLEKDDPDKRQEGIGILEEIASSTTEEMEGARISVAEAIRGQDELGGLEGVLLTLLEDPSSRVVRAAMAAAAQHRNPSLVGVICKAALRFHIEPRAVSSIREYGQEAIGPLTGLLADPRNPRRLRELAARCLGRLGRPEAADGLGAGLVADDRAVRYSALRALNHLRRHGTDTGFADAAIKAAIVTEWSDLLTLQRLAGALGEPGLDGPLPFVATVLRERVDEATERVFRALGLRYPLDAVFYSYRGLETGDPEARAHALELIDNVVDGPLRRPLLQWLESANVDERVEIACRELDRPPPGDTAEALRELADPADPWLAACALRALQERGDLELDEGELQEMDATGYAPLSELLDSFRATRPAA